MSITEDFGLESFNQAEGYDQDEDSLPILQVIHQRKIQPTPHCAATIIVEAHVGEESVYIRAYTNYTQGPTQTNKTYFYCYMSVDETTEKDFLDPSMVLDTLEEKIQDGLIYKVAEYFDHYGRNISDPIEFHIGLRAISL